MIIIVGDGQRPATLAYATWAIMALLTLCSLGYLFAEYEEQREIFHRFGVSPPLWIAGQLRATFIDFGQIGQLISASMVQPGHLALLGNVALLWVLGDDIEHAIGWLRFIVLFCAGCTIGLMASIVSHSQSMQPMLGAFGGVGAVMGAFALYRPAARLRILILGRELRMKAWLVLPMWMILAPLAPLMAERHIDKPIVSLIAMTLLAGVLTGALLAPLLWRDKSTLLSDVMPDRDRAKAAVRAISFASLALLALPTVWWSLSMDLKQVTASAGDVWFERAERIVTTTTTPGPVVRKWLENSIDYGNTRAAATLGWLLENARHSGLEADPRRAAELYALVSRRGASDGLASIVYAQVDRGLGLLRDEVRWVRPAAEAGEARAQHIVAVAYRYAIGMPRDIERARYWARRAADQGHKDSIKLLAELDAISR
jgi:membrane associated rhomboid family serine protease